MVSKNRPNKWYCLGKSVRGASHIRNGLPNQDAISWLTQKSEYPQRGDGLPIILAVSDGHGSSKNFRSDVGSKKAVAIATKVIREFFLEGESDRENFSTIKDKAQNILPQRLAHEWKQAVEQHWNHNQVTEEEWERVIKEGGTTVRQSIERHPSVAYGATLLGVLVAESFILYCQLGDGDILCIDSTGEIARPIARDPKLIANETTSLCTPNAWQDFQVSLTSLKESPVAEPPALILVATDGYSNSFPSEEEFIKVGKDYREMIRKNGVDSVEKSLENFLKETSEGGSGDDISIGIIKRIKPGDLDYQNYLDERITKNEKEQELQRDIMNIQREKIEDVSSTVKHLSTTQEIYRKKVLGVALGLAVTFPLALLGTSLSAWLFFRQGQVNSNIEQLKKQVEDLNIQLRGDPISPVEAPGDIEHTSTSVKEPSPEPTPSSDINSSQ